MLDNKNVPLLHSASPIKLEDQKYLLCNVFSAFSFSADGYRTLEKRKF